MRRRPLSVTLVGWLFLLTGCAGLAVASYRLADPATRDAAPPGADHFRDFAWAAASGLVAAAGGALVLRGAGRGRWALAAWMAGHVVLSAMHSAEQLAVHVAIFVPLSWLLFRREASAYFRGAGGGRDRGTGTAGP